MNGDLPRVPSVLTDQSTTLDVNVESAGTFVHLFQQLVSCAQRSLDRARAYQKKHADKRRRELAFNVGDRVMLSTTHLETTLPVRFDGVMLGRLL